MATATEYTTEQLNYYRICYVATDILPEGLRSIFKQEWDSRYTATMGEWKDEPRNGMDFYNTESTKNQRRNAHLLSTMINGDRSQWDCTMLFYAILFSDCIGPTLNPVVQLNVDGLRRFRNEEFAHLLRGQLSEGDFRNAMGKVRAAFQGLGLSTVQIQEITNQTTFPTEELRDILTKVENLKKELQEKEKQQQGLKDQLQENEEQRRSLEDQLKENKDQLQIKDVQRQVLEDQLQNDTPSFCILPPKPSHDIATRNSEVAKITQQLKELKQADENSLSYVYISGNPGSGKSQLAGLVAKKFFDNTQTDPDANAFVMTLNAESLGTLLESYLSFARLLKCPEYAITQIFQSKDLKTDKISYLKTLISPKVTSYTSWLLVVDNVKSISQVHVHLPGPGNEQWARGQLLVTTQDTTSIPLTSSFIRHVSVKKGMKPDDASSLLADLSGIAEGHMERNVAEALDYQPLALASAAIYVKQLRQSKPTSHFGWNDYLDKIRKGQRLTTETILAETNPSYPKSMTKATELAVNEIVKSNKVINRTLCFLSTCAPEPLSQDIVINYILNVDEEIQDKEMIITTIQRCSLILLEEEDDGIYIGVHQVVRDVIQALMKKYPESIQQEAVNRAITAFSQFIGDSLPENQWLDIDTVAQTKRVAPHLKCLIIKIENLISKENFPRNIKSGTDMLKLGRTCEHHCDFDSARKYCEHSLETFLRMSGPDHHNVATSYRNLGSVYEELGEFEEAKQFYHSALDIELKMLGAEHVNVAISYSHLGSVYEELGEFEEAKQFYHHALDTALKKLGPEHVSVATSYSNLGSVYEKLGEFEEAKQFYHRALAIELKKLGPEHVNVAISYSNLGSVYEKLGEFEEAKRFHHRALDIEMKKLGPEHVSVATSYSNLGSVYEELGEFEEAKQFHHRALDIELKKLGPEHVNVAISYSNLGSAYKELGESEEAKQFHHRALDIELKKLGSEHISVATSYSNLGSVYEELGEFEEAKHFYHRALDIELKKLGPEHVSVATSYSNLGSVYEKLGEFEEAKEFHHRASNIQRKMLETAHVTVEKAAVALPLRETTDKANTASPC